MKKKIRRYMFRGPNSNGGFSITTSVKGFGRVSLRVLPEHGCSLNEEFMRTTLLPILKDMIEKIPIGLPSS